MVSQASFTISRVKKSETQRASAEGHLEMMTSKKIDVIFSVW